MNKRVTLTVLSLLLLLGLGWVWLVPAGEDPQVTAAKQLREETFKNIDQMTDEQRRASFESMREMTRGMSDAQRQLVWQGARQDMARRVDRLLAMPKAEQNRELDRLIDRSEQRRKERAAGGERGRGGPDGAGPRGDGPPGGGASRGKARLDRSSPEMRAKMDAMGDLINARRVSRGMKPERGPGLFVGRGPR